MPNQAFGDGPEAYTVGPMAHPDGATAHGMVQAQPQRPHLSDPLIITNPGIDPGMVRAPSPVEPQPGGGRT